MRDLLLDKKSYRKIALERRNNISKEDRDYFSMRITDSILESKPLKHADNVLIYCSYLSEVNTKKLIERLIHMGKRVYCPKVTDPKEGIMDFFRVRDMESIKEGFHGIPEPETNEKYMTGTDRLHNDTLMILPGVAFDRHCNRIGYNGGYYDRYIPRVPGAYLVAFAFDEQMFEDIFPMESHDIKPDEIYTQTRHIKR